MDEATFHRIMALRCKLSEEEKRKVDAKIQKMKETMKLSKLSICFHCRQGEHKKCFHLESLPCECPVCHPREK